jgi:hypothetical protein
MKKQILFLVTTIVAALAVAIVGVILHVRASVTASRESAIYLNRQFGLSFDYPETFKLIEQYPSTWPSTTAPSFQSPYLIQLYRAGDSYSSLEIRVFPASAWAELVSDIQYQAGAYHFDFANAGERLQLGQEGSASRYTGDFDPYLYYIQPTGSVYVFTMSFSQPPQTPGDWLVYYDILSTMRFSSLPGR